MLPAACQSSRMSSSEDISAVIARVAPDLLALLGDGTPRLRKLILDTLLDRHPRDDIKRAIMRLTVTGELVEDGGKYALAPAPSPGEGLTLLARRGPRRDPRLRVRNPLFGGGSAGRGRVKGTPRMQENQGTIPATRRARILLSNSADRGAMYG
jgi:hypothetical protein